MKRSDNMPLWVFLGLMSVETRKGAMTLVWFCLVAAFICIPVSWYLQDWSYAAMMFAITPWYWFSVKWVDRNASWEC